MYNDRRKKIIRISLIVLGIIIIVLIYLFIKSKQQTETTGNKGNFFLDLGSLITGKRQNPNGVSLTPNGNGLGGSNGSGNGNGSNNGSGNGNGSGSPLVLGGLPEPTPIAQNIGGGFGTNNRDLFPDNQNPNNCIGCSGSFGIGNGDLGSGGGSGNSGLGGDGLGDDGLGGDGLGDDGLGGDGLGDVSSYVYINAVPSAIHKDDEVTVTWESSNVNTCFASSFPVVPGWNGSTGKSGTKYFSLNKPTTFIIKCSTTSGTVQASDSVSVLADDVPLCKEDNTCFLGDSETGKYVSAVMEASPYIVESGDTSLLAWDTENATMCNANSVPLRDDWRGLIPQSSGETDITLPSTPVTYILTCTDGKTTGQTDVTISIDTSKIDDGRDFGDDPIDLCSRSEQERNPLCLVRDISIDEEEKILILTNEEQAILDSLMKEVAIMSPTLPSNQTSSSLDISTQTYRAILSDIEKNVSTCYDLTQNTSKNQDFIDALWERQIVGRRPLPFLGNRNPIFEIPINPGATTYIYKSKDGSTTEIKIPKNLQIASGGSKGSFKIPIIPETSTYTYTDPVRGDKTIIQIPKELQNPILQNISIYLQNLYPVKPPSAKLLKKYYDFARSPGNTWRATELGEGERDCPGRRITTTYKNDIQGTFIFPWLGDGCWYMNSYKTNEDDAQKGIYDLVPGYGRMQEQVEYGSDTKGIKIF